MKDYQNKISEWIRIIERTVTWILLFGLAVGTWTIILSMIWR